MGVAGHTRELDMMDLPLQLDISVRAGDTYRQGWTLQVDNGSGPEPMDVTNVEFTLAIYDTDGVERVAGTEQTAGFTESGINVDSGVDGQITVNIADADTAELESGVYAYEIVAEWSPIDPTWPSLTKTLFVGHIIIEPDTAVGESS